MLSLCNLTLVLSSDNLQQGNCHPFESQPFFNIITKIHVVCKLSCFVAQVVAYGRCLLLTYEHIIVVKIGKYNTFQSLRVA